MLDRVLLKFGLHHHLFITPFGNGLINNTWLVDKRQTGEKFILQRINQQIFKNPVDIATNIRLIADYLKIHYPGYLFVAPLLTNDGQDLVETPKGFFRLFNFVKHSHTIDIVQKPEQAYQAASQFGQFTRKLAGINVSQLKITLPDFHNLTLRFKNFEEVLQNGNKDRIEQSKDLILLIYQHKKIVEEFENIRSHPHFKIRVTHHDTKISNVLFNSIDKGICIIDLDTVMPGYFISDIGDMMRTYLSPANEEEKDFSKIVIRQDFYNAIVTGYLTEMDNELTETEKSYFIYAGKFIIYMQAIRFLTDFISGDIYYGAKYEGHNFVRAGNQLTLLEKLLEFEQNHPILSVIKKKKGVRNKFLTRLLSRWSSVWRGSK